MLAEVEILSAGICVSKARHQHAFVCLRAAVGPTEVKIGKSGKRHFGVKKCLFWGSPLGTI